MFIYIYRDNQSYGPYDEFTIDELLKNGQCIPTDLAFCEGMTEWQPLWTLVNIPSVTGMRDQWEANYLMHDYPPPSSLQMRNQHPQGYAEYFLPEAAPNFNHPKPARYSSALVSSHNVSKQKNANSFLPVAQLFGLDLRSAALLVLIDFLVFTGNTFSFSILLPLGIAAAIVLAVIIYKIQRHWYGDDRDSALIKALLCGLLTAIPVPITPFIALPGGFLGLIKLFLGKS